MSADEKQIRSAVESFRVALEQNKPDALTDLFWPDALVFEDGQLVKSPAELVAHVKQRLARGSVRWVDEKNVGRSDGPLAFVAQLAKVKEKSKGGEKAGTYALTFVLRRRNGEWRISHLHWSHAA